MKLIDTHSHIYFKNFDNDRDSVINNFIKTGGLKIIVPDIDSDNRTKMFEIISTYPDVLLPAVGIHPTSVNNNNFNKEINLLHDFVNSGKNKIVAIGECGLDYYWDKSYINEQKKVFTEQIIIANSLNLPLIIHSRCSLEDIIKIIKENNSYPVKGVFHCFPGNLNEALLLINMGFYLGIGGVITYPKNNFIEVVKNVPLEFILIETDSPFLSPVPYRGKRNEPSYSKIIVETIAQIKNTNVDLVAEITTENAKKLFNIK